MSLSEAIKGGTTSFLPAVTKEFAPPVMAQKLVAEIEKVEIITINTERRCPRPSFQFFKLGRSSTAIFRVGVRIKISINTIIVPVQT